MKSKQITKLSLCALLSALCFIGFEYLRIDIPLPTGSTAIHFGNAFCVLAALLLPGYYGYFAGAIGMTIADLLNPLYVVSAPKTFILKLCIALIVSTLAHKVGRIDKISDQKEQMRWAILASIAGMGFNIIFDPLASFLYKNYLLGVEYSVAKVFAAWGAMSTFVNAITSVIIACILFQILYPRLKNKVN